MSFLKSTLIAILLLVFSFGYSFAQSTPLDFSKPFQIAQFGEYLQNKAEEEEEQEEQERIDNRTEAQKIKDAKNLYAKQEIEIKKAMEPFRIGDCIRIYEFKETVYEGDPQAEYILSQLHLKGWCVKKDEAQMLKYLKLSADQKYRRALYDYARFLYTGEIGILPKDDREALKFFNKAADEGDPKAMYFIGEMHAKGDSVRLDYNKAAKWYIKAGDYGLSSAYSKVAILYLGTKLGQVDREKAIKYARLGAEGGDQYSQYLLASLLFVKGKPEYDPFESYIWTIVSLTGKNESLKPPVKELQKKIEPLLSKDDLKRASAKAYYINEETLSKGIEKLPKIPEDLAHGMTKEKANATLKKLKLGKTRGNFFQSVEEDNLGVFKLYLAAGVSIESESAPNSGITPLYRATEHQSEKIFNFLVTRPINVNPVSVDTGATPLLIALENKNVDMAEKLLKLGADATQKPNGNDIAGYSPLLVALEYASVDLIDMLIKNGANLNEKYYAWQETPVMHVSKNCRESVLNYLLKNGASIIEKDLEGRNALMHALDSRYTDDCISILLDNGADVSNKSINNVSALFYAVNYNNIKLLNQVIKLNVNVDDPFKFKPEQIPRGFTPEESDMIMHGGSVLMLAVHRNYEQIVKTLLNKGADPNYKIEGGFGHYSAKIIAKNQHNKDMIEIIKPYDTGGSDGIFGIIDDILGK